MEQMDCVRVGPGLVFSVLTVWVKVKRSGAAQAWGGDVGENGRRGGCGRVVQHLFAAGRNKVSQEKLPSSISSALSSTLQLSLSPSLNREHMSLYRRPEAAHHGS